MRSQFVPAGDQVTLSNCDREPIHTPGAVQPHGALFAIDPVTLRVMAVSENSGSFGFPAETVVNVRCGDAFGAPLAAWLQAAVEHPAASTQALVRHDFFAEAAARVHRAGDTLYLELEPAGREHANLVDRIGEAFRQFGDEADLGRLCDDGAHLLRELTGYDRVMVYRFDSDGHGSVIAESKEPRLEAFLGQRYPASDIPRQARELYRTTMLRLIVDVDYEPAAIAPVLDPRTREPWDLGRANLRSVSPIHIQYLKNMGVTATMTVSLLRAGELWGLIACHHYSPKYVGHELRSTAESIGRALVTRVAQLEDEASSRARAAVRAALVEFMSFAGSDRYAEFVRSNRLHTALGFDGSALVREGSVINNGGPPAERISALAAWLDERQGVDVFVTDNLAKLNPAFRDIVPIASGVFAHRTNAGWVFGFRGEVPQTIAWGGDPGKAAAPAGEERLTPRGSFETWREEVRERADPWQPAVLEGLDDVVRWAQSGGSR